MQCLRPRNTSTFQNHQCRFLAVIELLKITVAQARVEHQDQITQVQRMGNSMLGQKNLLFVLSKLLRDLIQVDYTVVDGLFIRVVLRDSQTLRNALQTLVQLPQLQGPIPHAQNTVIDLVTGTDSLHFLLEKIAQGFIEVPVHRVDRAHRNLLLCIEETS